VSAPGGKIRRVVPNIRGEHLAECRAFYEQVIGLELNMDLGWIATFVSPTNPTAQLSVISEDATAAAHPDVSVEVEDVDAVHAAAVASRLEIVHPLTDEPWGVRRFFVRDPNGAVVNVMTHLDA
jgi:catechol 2,3-dioxygenase-like lactoylglutathione lyase family enzyme